MGWTTPYETFEKKSDVKEYFDEGYTWNESIQCKCLKSRIVGNTYYAAVERTKIEEGKAQVDVIAIIIRLSFEKYGGEYQLSYKFMDESFCPCYYDCPKSILRLLTPTDNEFALEWRRECWEKLNEPKLSDLPLRTVIIWKRCVGYDAYEELELIKTYVPRYKTPQWVTVKPDEKGIRYRYCRNWINDWKVKED